MTKKIGLISNTGSGWNLGNLHRMERFASGKPEIVHCPVDNFNQIPGVLGLFAEKDVEFLAINGGDGTVQAVLTELYSKSHFASMPFIVLLNGGSTNMLSRDAGLNKRPLAGLKHLLSKLGKEPLGLQISKRNILRVEYADQGYRVQYGMFLGTGLICRAVSIYQQKIRQLKLPGVLNSVFGVLYGFYQLKAGSGEYAGICRTSFKTREKSHPAQENHLFFLTTLNRLILGLYPGKCAGREKIKFVLLRRGFGNFPGFCLLVLSKGCRVGKKAAQAQQCVEKMEFAPCTGFVLDGEIFEPDCRERTVAVSDAGCLDFVVK